VTENLVEAVPPSVLTIISYCEHVNPSNEAVMFVGVLVIEEEVFISPLLVSVNVNDKSVSKNLPSIETVISVDVLLG
jgi:hypothetical protein